MRKKETNQEKAGAVRQRRKERSGGRGRVKKKNGKKLMVTSKETRKGHRSIIKKNIHTPAKDTSNTTQ